MALEQEPWSRVTYNGFARSAAAPRPAPAAPARRLRTRRRTSATVAGAAALALLVTAVIAGLPAVARLWSGVPLSATLPGVFAGRQEARPVPAAPVQPAAALAIDAPPAPAPTAVPAKVRREPPPKAAAQISAPLAERAEGAPPKPGRGGQRPRRGLSAAARERASEATAAANFAATVAPESTLADQAAAGAGAEQESGLGPATPQR